MDIRAWRDGKPLQMTRRGFVRSSVAGAGGLTALALVGCGDDDDDEPGSTPGSTTGSPTTAGGSATATAPTSAPIKGGTWTGGIESGPTSLDVMAGSSFTTSLYGSYSYSRLLKFRTGPGVDPGAFDIDMDLASEIEQPDVLTYTVKLRPNAKFHDPVSRAVTPEDVVFSYERSLENAIGLTANNTDSVTAIDDETVQFKVKVPDAEYLNLNKSFFVMPVETGTVFNPTEKMVGTGPFIFEEYQTDNLITYRRNPEWHFGPDAPYFDRIELSVVPEYATRLSQFLGGNIDHIELQGNDVQRAVSGIEDLQIFRGMLGLSWSYISFAGNPEDANQPWRDVRVRRAASMAMDRDGLTEAAYNVSKLQEALPGLTVEWNNVVPNPVRPMWLDPKGQYQYKDGDPKISDLGASAFPYDPEGAKALLAEAGYPDGFDVDGAFHYPIARYGEAFRIISELQVQYLSQIGFRVKSAPEDYAAVFAPTSLLGDFDGLLHVAGGGGYPLTNSFNYYYLPGAIRNNGFINDQVLIDAINDARATFDNEERRVKILQLQQYTSEKMYYVPGQIGAVGSFLAYQPNIGGALDYQSPGFDQGSEQMPFLWKTDG